MAVQLAHLFFWNGLALNTLVAGEEAAAAAAARRDADAEMDTGRPEERCGCLCDTAGFVVVVSSRFSSPRPAAATAALLAPVLAVLLALPLLPVLLTRAPAPPSDEKAARAGSGCVPPLRGAREMRELAVPQRWLGSVCCLY